MKRLELRISGVSRRDELVAQAKKAGIAGAVRLPDHMLFGRTDDPSGDLSDSMIICLDRAREDGYRLWLTANADRLATEVSESGAEDGCSWLRQQYTLETRYKP